MSPFPANISYLDIILFMFPNLSRSWASYQALEISKFDILLVNQGGTVQNGPTDSVLIRKSWIGDSGKVIICSCHTQFHSTYGQNVEDEFFQVHTDHINVHKFFLLFWFFPSKTRSCRIMKSRKLVLFTMKKKNMKKKKM